MVITQKQVEEHLQSFDKIIASLKKQLKYLELNRHLMTKQLTIPVVGCSFCGGKQFKTTKNYKPAKKCIDCKKVEIKKQ